MVERWSWVSCQTVFAVPPTVDFVPGWGVVVPPRSWSMAAATSYVCAPSQARISLVAHGNAACHAYAACALRGFPAAFAVICPPHLWDAAEPGTF